MLFTIQTIVLVFCISTSIATLRIVWIINCKIKYFTIYYWLLRSEYLIANEGGGFSMCRGGVRSVRGARAVQRARQGGGSRRRVQRTSAGRHGPKVAAFTRPPHHTPPSTGCQLRVLFNPRFYIIFSHARLFFATSLSSSKLILSNIQFNIPFVIKHIFCAKT